MDDITTAILEDATLATPLSRDVGDMHGAPPTLRREASVAKRLDDSFNEYAMRPGLRTVGQQEHQQSAEGNVESTTWLVMSEMRRMTEESDCVTSEKTKILGDSLLTVSVRMK